MNWVLIVTGGIILIGFLIGIYRGAIRIAVSLLATMITLVVVTLATPYIAKAVSKYTPLDDMIQEQISNALINAATSSVSTEEGGGLTEAGVRHVLEGAGVSEEELNGFGISIKDIVSGKVDGEELADFGISRSLLDGLKSSGAVEDAVENAEIPRDLQVAAIEGAEIPEIFKTLLSTNNNSEIYDELGVETFAQYVGSFLSKLIIHIVAFLCTFLIVTIILRAVIFALDVVSDLPMLGIINRIAGGAVGILCALIVVWIIFVIITLLYVTSFGKEAYELIQSNGMLKIIYEYNPVMGLATKI